MNYKLQIFPNPASSYITIKISSPNLSPNKYILTLRNIQGQEELSKNVEFTNTNTLDITNLASGMYFLSLQNDKENYVSKVVIQK